MPILRHGEAGSSRPAEIRSGRVQNAGWFQFLVFRLATSRASYAVAFLGGLRSARADMHGGGNELNGLEAECLDFCPVAG